jgi:hypothetical protein
MRSLLFSLLLAAPALAQAWTIDDGFIGVSPRELRGALDEARGRAAESRFGAVETEAVAAAPRFPQACVFGFVDRIFGTEDFGAPKPRVVYGSRMDFQQRRWYSIALRAQGLPDRGGAIQNLYDQATNTVYLDDRPDSYKGARSIDDVLAHEYTHFLQLNHPKVPYNTGDGDGDAEVVAVQVQMLFRERVILGGEDPCASPD